MELRQLRYFVKVAETCNFSEAARALNITQSTLSQQIRQLEGELNAEFFTRDSHHVMLTEVGKEFLPSAKRTIADADSCIDRIHDIQNLSTGVLNVGCTYTFCPLLKETVLEFIKLYPNIRLNIFCKSMEELMEMLTRHEIDLALSYKPSQQYDNIESYTLFDNRLCAIVSETHPIAKMKDVRLQDLEDYHIALPARGMQARNTLDRLIEGHNYRFNIGVEINEVNVLLDIVRNSSFVTFLSQATIGQRMGFVAVPISNNGCEMQGSFHYLRGSYHKKSSQEFLRILCSNKSFGMAMMTIF
ncbi:MAG: LysR substrate-binding domain-containing protein [Bacteroidales bacterium]|nr:LysR substrate-binding domain-containing protein [Bacteroidales bacterium]